MKDFKLYTHPIGYGIDRGSPDGDETALAINDNGNLHIFTGQQAEVIITLIETRVHAEQKRIAKLLAFELGYPEKDLQYLINRREHHNG